jgi:hypothetical protein
MISKEKGGTLRASHRTAPERIQQAYGWRGQPQLRYSLLFFAALQTRFFKGVPMHLRCTNGDEKPPVERYIP